MNKKEWIENKAGSVLSGLDELGIDFYYMAMHDNGMDLYDADRYAWLNVLFGYDIGADHAREIINWCYEHDIDVMDLCSQDKEMMMDICFDEFGFHLSFIYWADEEPEYISYKYMAVPRIKKRIDKMFADGYTIDEVCGCICGLYHEYLIDEAHEYELYKYADPDDTMKIAPFEAWNEFEGNNPLDYTEEV